MSKSTKEWFDDARGMMARANTRLIVIGGGLILLWCVTFEPASQILRSESSKLSVAIVQETKLTLLAKNQRIARDKLKADFATREANVRTDCSPGAKGAAGCGDARRALAVTQARQARLVAQIDRTSLARWQKSQTIDDIQNKLAERVSFDVGQGFKLPFSLLDAPLVWLTFLAILLLWLGYRRAACWRSIAQAIGASGDVSRTELNETIVDAPRGWHRCLRPQPI